MIGDHSTPQARADAVTAVSLISDLKDELIDIGNNLLGTKFKESSIEHGQYRLRCIVHDYKSSFRLPDGIEPNQIWLTCDEYFTMQVSIAGPLYEFIEGYLHDWK